MSVVLLIVSLAVLIFVHELGHFLAAKRSGIRVLEFGFGFPPKIFGIRKGETLYSINLIPFGGFVKIFGEDPADDSISPADKKVSFAFKPKLTQAKVLVAGVIGNFLFAWFLFTLLALSGVPTSTADVSNPSTDLRDVRLRVTHVEKFSPAEKAGLMAGDSIFAVWTVAGEGWHGDYLPDASAFRDFITKYGASPIKIAFSRGDKVVTSLDDSSALFLVTHPTKGVITDDMERYGLGVGIDDIGIKSLSIPEAIYYGGRATILGTWEIVKGLGGLVAGIFTGGTSLSSVSGPVRMSQLFAESYQIGWRYFISLLAFVSLNLGVINLVPIPALDGGRLFFLGIESIKGSPVSPRIVHRATLIGFSLLMILMILVTYSDIRAMFFSAPV